MKIPQEAIDAAAQARLGPYPRLDELLPRPALYERNKAEEMLEAAAPIIVATELRRLADQFDASLAPGDGESVLAQHVGFTTGALRSQADILEREQS